MMGVRLSDAFTPADRAGGEGAAWAAMTEDLAPSRPEATGTTTASARAVSTLGNARLAVNAAPAK